ncbi:CinA family protein [Aurantivibrio infirmus]
MSSPQKILHLVEQLSQLLRARKWTVTAAESCTGGGVAYAFTTLSGSSDWFEAGFVTYSNALKVKLLSVSEITLDEWGAVSEEVVRQMAQGALVGANANVAVAISGIAGPDGGTDAKPVGTVWMSWAIKDGEIVTRRFQFSGDREEIRHSAVAEAVMGLIELISKSPV